ncbi:MAG: hypothetical protein ACREQJ_07500 [Candidatus Binatia bacterium]
MNTLLATLEVPYYAIVDFALGAPRAASFTAVAIAAAVGALIAL